MSSSMKVSNRWHGFCSDKILHTYTHTAYASANRLRHIEIYIHTNSYVLSVSLTLSWRRQLPYRNQPIDFPCKLMDWFLYDNGLRHKRVNIKNLPCTVCLQCLWFSKTTHLWNSLIYGLDQIRLNLS